MADNTVTVTPPGSTNADTIRDIDRGGLGVKTQVVQLDAGGAGATESLVSASNPLPVMAASDTYSAASGAVTVSGTLHSTTAGKTLRLFYYMLNADAGNAGPITVSLSFTTGGAITTVSLVPGAILARNVGAGKYYLPGAVNDNLLVTITGTGTLNWATESKEV